MFRSVAIVVAALAVVLGMCSSINAQNAGGKFTRCNTGKYQAHQIDNIVFVVAYGHHNTGGYKVKLRLLPIDIYPPQYELVHQKPGGFAIQVITPFAAVAHFKAAERIKSIMIHDANGQHKIAVKHIGK